MRTATQEAFLSIIRYEIAGTPLPEGFNVPDIDALVKLADMQDLTHLIYDALTKNALPCSSKQAFTQYYAALWRVEQIDHELQQIAGLFEEHGIDFIPLKGAVVRALYPQRWMRTSTDIDILLRRNQEKEAEKLLVEKLGYDNSEDDFSPHHGSLYSPNSHIHVEPHWTLFSEAETNISYVDLFARVWDRAVPDPAGCGHRYMLSDADVFTYHIAHMEKHFRHSGGCSVRGLVDLWLMDRMPDADKEGRRELLAQGGLTKFEDKIKKLIYAWMEGLPAENEYLEQYVLSGYLYGDRKRQALLETKKSGKFKYVLKRIFMPYSQIKNLYPVLEKHPYLLPAMWVRRWAKVVDKSSRDRLSLQVRSSVTADDQALRDLRELSEYLGIQ